MGRWVHTILIGTLLVGAALSGCGPKEPNPTEGGPAVGGGGVRSAEEARRYQEDMARRAGQPGSPSGGPPPFTGR